MHYQPKFTERFLEKIEVFRGTGEGKILVELMRRVLADPIGSGQPGMLPGIRFGYSGIKPYYVSWIVCEECFEFLPAERQQEPCAFCTERNQVIFISFYLSF